MQRFQHCVALHDALVGAGSSSGVALPFHMGVYLEVKITCYEACNILRELTLEKMASRFPDDETGQLTAKQRQFTEALVNTVSQADHNTQVVRSHLHSQLVQVMLEDVHPGFDATIREEVISSARLCCASRRTHSREEVNGLRDTFAP